LALCRLALSIVPTLREGTLVASQSSYPSSNGKIDLTGYRAGRHFRLPSGRGKGWKMLMNPWSRYPRHSLVSTYGAGCPQNRHGSISFSVDETVAKGNGWRLRCGSTGAPVLSAVDRLEGYLMGVYSWSADLVPDRSDDCLSQHIRLIILRIAQAVAHLCSRRAAVGRSRRPGKGLRRHRQAAVSCPRDLA
jgi:hypothetical protein